MIEINKEMTADELLEWAQEQLCQNLSDECVDLDQPKTKLEKAILPVVKTIQDFLNREGEFYND